MVSAGSTRESVMAMELFACGPTESVGRGPCSGVDILQAEPFQRELPRLDIAGPVLLGVKQCRSQAVGNPQAPAFASPPRQGALVRRRGDSPRGPPAPRGSGRPRASRAGGGP